MPVGGGDSLRPATSLHLPLCPLRSFCELMPHAPRLTPRLLYRSSDGLDGCRGRRWQRCRSGGRPSRVGRGKPMRMVHLWLTCSLAGLLFFGACRGENGELLEYARQMDGYFGDVDNQRMPEGIERLASLQPPDEMRSSHDRLVESTRLAALADAHVWMVWMNMNPRVEMWEGQSSPCQLDTNDLVLQEACQISQMAESAYLRDTSEWAETLSRACGGSDSEAIPTSAIDTCLK
jgi:hypothetical protein